MVQTDWRDIVRRIANRLDEAVESAASARGMLEVAGQLMNDMEKGDIIQVAMADQPLDEYVAQVAAQNKQLKERCARLRTALEAYDPPMPPLLEGETAEEYTDRLTGADGTGRRPYAERRLRQCSIGYHDNCSDPDGIDCKCPCHQFERLRREALAAEAMYDTEG